MEIKNNYLKALILVLFALVVLGCESQPNNKQIKIQLGEAIDSRLNTLRGSFRHKLLAYSGETIPVDEMNNFFNVLDQSQSLVEINDEILKLASPLNVAPVNITEGDDVELSILLNQLLILDELVFQSQVSNTFESLKATAFIKSETRDEIEYYIGLTAYDELFNPEVELFSKSDTLAVDVNDDGFGYFIMKKKSPNQRHTFSGDVIIYASDGSKKRLPFKFGDTSN